MEGRVITRLAALPRPASFKESEKAVQRVAAYARVSTSHEEQETSLAAQTDYYRKKILAHPGWEFVEIYVDDGFSGLSTRHREGFNRMMEDCLAGRIDLLLTNIKTTHLIQYKPLLLKMGAFLKLKFVRFIQSGWTTANICKKTAQP